MLKFHDESFPNIKVQKKKLMHWDRSSKSPARLFLCGVTEGRIQRSACEGHLTEIPSFALTSQPSNQEGTGKRKLPAGPRRVLLKEMTRLVAQDMKIFEMQRSYAATAVVSLSRETGYHFARK